MHDGTDLRTRRGHRCIRVRTIRKRIVNAADVRRVIAAGPSNADQCERERRKERERDTNRLGKGVVVPYY